MKQYAVIERDYGYYGIGSSREEAITAAVKWLNEDGGKRIAKILELLISDHVNFRVIDSDSAEWSEYII